ncbi:MAG: hypothetical protein QOF12_267, partial [Solirubrobacteraceae bacterium]|nr:hypothetical protein [Solirubrobacteraceae bacterium]
MAGSGVTAGQGPRYASATLMALMV